MLTKQSRSIPSVPYLRQVLWKLFPVSILVFLSGWFGYRSGLFRWHQDVAGSRLDMFLLGVCLTLLLGLYLEGVWSMVRTKAAENSARSVLEESMARLNSLFQTIPDLVWLKDVHGTYLACNPAFERLYGKKEREIIGKTDYDFVSDAMAAFFREHDRAALLSGVARKNEEWLTFADNGKSFYFETIKIPVKTSDGELVGVMGIARDITRRHEAEQQADFFRKLVEFSGDPIYVLDRSSGFRMLFANQAACRHFGVSKEVVLGWNVFDWNPDVTQADLDRINAQLRVSGSMMHETHHRCGNGEIVPVEVSINRLVDDGRELSAGYIRNVSERKRAEAMLQQSRDQLRQVIAHQDRIREGERKRIAREIHDELGQHLLALRIEVSLLPQMASENPAIAARVNEILKNFDATVQNVRAIINNLRPSVLDLGFFAAMEWQVQDFARTSGIKCELHGSEEELHLEENQATALFRVLQEALVNVQKHAVATRVRISLERERDRITMLVSDDGVSLSNSQNGNWDASELLGIRERIAMQGGQIRLETGNGTLLTVTLPVGSGVSALGA